MKRAGDFIIVAFLVLLGPLLTLLFNLKPLVGGVIMLLPPSLYLMLRSPKNLPKILIAVLVFGGLFGFWFDFLEEFNRAWTTTRPVFPIKVLGVDPLDNLIGYGFMTLFITVFYEHFVDSEKNRRISKNLLWAAVIGLLAIAGMIINFIMLNGRLVQIPYSYLTLGILAIILPVIIFINKPKLIYKSLGMAVFFFFMWLISEFAALKTGGWVFNGQYVGLVTFLGVTFPFEELFFWMMLYSSAVVAYYELFVDDLK